MFLLVAALIYFAYSGVTDYAPSHLRLRKLSDMQEERSRMLDDDAVVPAPSVKRQLQAGADFTVTPDVVGSMAVVTLKWQGVAGASSKDIIAYFCGNASDTHRLDYFRPNIVPTYRQV
jgi:hypothetical protein